ncbi:hypothetical protein [Streptomyces radicis]|uniref:Uncharacterized protein n=1 Tax=Streptomyces radicis TaxID=1750517 RepID=A0A3A9VUT5_9ACTN|nr:hypothetical protein [Streptomyces radicis]RKN04851.1 hypothetical protein D7319_27000 [Streptomyces radicis]RKN25361.1 hypothetical protein D7318_09160 [Streptomyces radicis]
MTTGPGFLLSLLAGVLAANATPHFIRGITKKRFPTPFGDGPLINLVAGWAMYVAASTGVLAMGVFHATTGAFGKGRPPAQGGT